MVGVGLGISHTVNSKELQVGHNIYWLLTVDITSCGKLSRDQLPWLEPQGVDRCKSIVEKLGEVKLKS